MNNESHGHMLAKYIPAAEPAPKKSGISSSTGALDAAAAARDAAAGAEVAGSSSNKPTNK